MFFIIWGFRARTKTVTSGEFNCPSCATRQPYLLKRIVRYFTLYFIPLFPTKELGEYVECDRCHQTYRPEVLNYQPVESSLALNAS